ncbi:MAG: hypothetical protein ACM3PC_13970 [Deltaproteobacteria bacterium]
MTTNGVLEADGGTLSGPSTTSCDLPHNDLPPASVSLQGLGTAAPFLDALANGPLDDATIHGVPANPDASVGRLLGKIVSCALAPGDNLSDVAGIPLHGELGLCAEWAHSSLSPTRKPGCLQVVSSCVLARVNAIGARVVLSLRASDPALLPVRNAVPVEDQYREHHGTPIPSFQPCNPSSSRANCGFLRGYVGQCVPGRTVSIVAKPSGTTIRVCRGLHGCDRTITGSPPQPIRAYAGLVGEGVDSLKVACPISGYYGVMVKPPSQAKPAVKVKSTGGTYPAEEKRVFSFAEGAFYGDIFETGKYRDRCAGQMLGGDQYACFGKGWTSGVDQFNDRYCNLGTGSNCLVNQPMPCFRGAPDDRCESDAVSGLGFARCRATFPPASGPAPGPQVPWQLPLTTYLNNPCDLSSDPACDPDSVFKTGPEHGYKPGQRTGTRPPKSGAERRGTAHRLGG